MNEAQSKYPIEPISPEQYFLLQKENEELRNRNLFLEHELGNLKRIIFGSKSERFIPSDPGQLGLFGKDQVEEQQQGVKETITYERNKPSESKQKPVRLALPAHLPRVEEVIEPQENLEGTKKIGETVTEFLEYIPGKLYVKKLIRPKYFMTHDQRIIIGELPSLPIPRSNVGPGLLAYILVNKFVDHLPFHRQIQQFKRQGVEIAESTMNDWFAGTARLMDPLYERLKVRVQQADYIMADETPIPVKTRDKPNAMHKGYHWLYFAPKEKLVCFDYQPGRGRAGRLFTEF